MTLPYPPIGIKEHYDWAQKLDHQFHRMQRIMGKTTQNRTGSPGNRNETKKNESNTRRFNFTRKDPNAMDVDTLTVEQREEYMRKGLCFGCAELGHRTRDCDKNKKKPAVAPPSQKTQTPPKKFAGKELHKHIRSLMTQMDKDEVDEFWKASEGQGF